MTPITQTKRCFFLSVFFCVICGLFLVFPGETPANRLPLTDIQADCILNRIQYELNLNPVYLWGGKSLKPGAPKDCSGTVYAHCAACGVDVKRVESRRMAAGEGKWDFPVIVWSAAKRLALIFMTFSDDRPDGHVGILIEDVQFGSVARMAHASYTYGFIASVVEDTPRNYWYPKITKIRQTVRDDA